MRTVWFKILYDTWLFPCFSCPSSFYSPFDRFGRVRSKEFKTEWIELQKAGCLAPDQSVKECSFCLEEFGKTELVAQLNCHRNHVFHSKCLESYKSTLGISDGLACPLCRQRQ